MDGLRDKQKLTELRRSKNFMLLSLSIAIPGKTAPTRRVKLHKFTWNWNVIVMHTIWDRINNIDDI